MKTALLLTNSAETQRLLTDILGDKTNIVLLPPPTEPSQEQFDALFSTWLRLVDAVILDAVSLGETTRWAVESLAAAHLQEHQAVVVRATVAQQSLYRIASNWLVVADSDSGDHLKQALGTFFELRDAQSRLKRADAVIARHRQTVAPMAAVVSHPPSTPASHAHASAVVPSFDVYRYRDALKDLSRILSQHTGEGELVSEFLRLVRELLGTGKAAIFTRQLAGELFTGQSAAPGKQFTVARSAGLAQHLVEHFRLSADSGIGNYLAREAKILLRAQAADSLAFDYDPEVAREFEALGTDVAVPVFDDDQMLGVLTFSGKVTGEPLTSQELELVYYLMAQLGRAIRNLHLRDRIAGQQRFVNEVLAHVQTGVVVVGQGNRVLTVNRRACELLELNDQEVVGQDISRLPSRVADVVFEALQTGQEIHQREVTLPRGQRPLGVSATRFAMASGGAVSGEGGLVAVALIEDLTQVRLQQARARELADKEFFTRLAARMSHELKNSLVSIKIFAQLLPERHDEKEFREQFSVTVANEVNRVDVLVNNLTFFAHPLLLVYEEVVLNDVIDTCLKNITQEFGRKQVAHVLAVGEKAPDPPQAPVVTVKKNFAHKFARLEGDRIRMMQAFEHVLRNAVQSMPQGGRLIISTADAQPTDFPDGKLPAGGAVRVDWQDTGEGIALEDLKRVTEPFVTTRNVGVGLGLTIVKKIVERHGGRLEIDSLLGRGTTVAMLLPLKAQPHPDDELLSQSLKAVAAAGLPGLGEADAGRNRVAEHLDADSGRRKKQS
ncbi:MAG TPA: ATP-binding protein [Verrucomicrobiae bacterium]|nr:ATP-binding protein [Verrucomicrobiae bacterium]